ncbi:MAG: PhoH family protein [Chlamydiia bacterium]|nr:PhoH family protein [Chlamydiia bacterium]
MADQKHKKPIKFNISLNEEQKLAKGLIFNNSITAVTGVAGTGKTSTAINAALDMLFSKKIRKIYITRPAIEAGDTSLGYIPGPQPLDSKVYTPDGYKSMLEMMIGDKVRGRDGSVHDVIDTKYYKDMPIYTIITSFGRKTRASDTHLWDVFIDGKYVMKTTVQIKELIKTHVVQLPIQEPFNNDSYYTNLNIVRELVEKVGVVKYDRIVLEGVTDEAELDILFSLGCTATIEDDGINIWWSPVKLIMDGDFEFPLNSEEHILDVIPEKNGDVKCLVLNGTEHLYMTDDYIVTHNSLEEKLAPWLKPIEQAIQANYSGNHGGMNKNDKMAKLLNEGQIDILSIGHARGINVENAILIVDEAQNISIAEARLLLTRIRQSGKIVLSGDINQSDIKGNNGLKRLLEIAHGHEDIAHIELVQNYRAEVVKYIDKELK